MPYCPRCDMEFVDGITVCSDCKGSLAESEEAAKALLKEQNQIEYPPDPISLNSDSENNQEKDTPVSKTRVYVAKSQKYEDLKSSASAFLLVGTILTIFSILCWTNMINLPMTGVTKLLFQGVINVMGIGFLIVSIITGRSARTMTSQIEEETHQTKEIIDWFTASYSAETIDRYLESEFQDLSPEELSLKRFELIQDYLVTERDLPDQAYVEALSEEIYCNLFE